jgi:molybdenum cofactor cytidylyltransferase
MQLGSGETDGARAARVAAIVLAAGRSTRMGAENKLLADVGGTPMVRLVVQAALASKARPVLAVTGHQAAEVGSALAGLDAALVANPDYATGLASSLKAGIRALPGDCSGVVVLLGDMPGIMPEHLDRLIETFVAGNGTAIVAPTYGRERGNPVVWPAAFFPGLLQLEGDAGARRLLVEHAGQVALVDLGTDAVLADIDTPEQLARTRGA